MILFLLLIGVPLIEIALFVTVGGAIGLWPTLACVVVTAVIGATVLRRQGVQALQALQRSIEEGGDPSGPLAHGAMLLLSGALLLTPGFFTDAVGLALLSPTAREAAIRHLGPRLAARVVVAGRARTGRAPGPRAPGGDAPIEAEYRDVTDDAPR